MFPARTPSVVSQEAFLLCSRHLRAIIGLAICCLITPLWSAFDQAQVREGAVRREVVHALVLKAMPRSELEAEAALGGSSSNSDALDKVLLVLHILGEPNSLCTMILSLLSRHRVS